MMKEYLHEIQFSVGQDRLVVIEHEQNIYFCSGQMASGARFLTLSRCHRWSSLSSGGLLYEATLIVLCWLDSIILMRLIPLDSSSDITIDDVLSWSYFDAWQLMLLLLMALVPMMMMMMHSSLFSFESIWVIWCVISAQDKIQQQWKKMLSDADE